MSNNQDIKLITILKTNKKDKEKKLKNSVPDIKLEDQNIYIKKILEEFSILKNKTRDLESKVEVLENRIEVLENKVEILENKKLENKKLKPKLKTKIICTCGCEIYKNYYKKHIMTKKHLKLIENKNKK